MKREEAIYCLKAQNELYSEVCEECPLYGQTGVDHCCEDALQIAITALKNQSVWIPVSERLPEELVPVNVTWINRNPESYYAKIIEWIVSKCDLEFDRQTEFNIVRMIVDCVELYEKESKRE